MLILDIHTLCRLHNEPNARAYLTRKGFSYWVAHKFANSKTKSISLEDLERLCKVFKCTPNDLFEWMPDDTTDNSPDNPLALLKKEKIEIKLSELPISKLKELAKSINIKT